MLICDIWAIYLLSSGALAFGRSRLCYLGEIFRSSVHLERMISGGNYVLQHSVDVASLHLPTMFILTTHNGCRVYECNGTYCGNFYHLKTIGQIHFK